MGLFRFFTGLILTATSITAASQVVISDAGEPVNKSKIQTKKVNCLQVHNIERLWIEAKEKSVERIISKVTSDWDSSTTIQLI